jgi:hypothetical protein
MDHSQCASGTCNGAWCTHSCGSNSACYGNAWCVNAASNQYLCFEGCTSNADCRIYGTGYSCQAATTISGTLHNICAQ